MICISNRLTHERYIIRNLSCSPARGGRMAQHQHEHLHRLAYAHGICEQASLDCSCTLHAPLSHACMHKQSTTLLASHSRLPPSGYLKLLKQRTARTNHRHGDWPYAIAKVVHKGACES